MRSDDSTTQLIESFFNRVYKPLTCKVQSSKGMFFIKIKDLCEIFFEEGSLPQYRFVRGDSDYDDMYTLFYYFLPQVSDKIEIYAIHEWSDSQNNVYPSLKLLPNYHIGNESH